MSVISWTKRKIIILGTPLLVLSLGLAVGAAIRYGTRNEAVGAANGTSGLHGPSIASFADSSVHVYALLWSGTDHLWYVGSSGDDVARLYRYEASTGRTMQWQVPLPTPQTLFTFLSEDGDGLIWVAANYTLAAFDPVSANFVYAGQLDLAAEGAEPQAFDRANPLPGTWVNGLAASQGKLFLTRQNVRAVFAVSKAGVEVSERLSKAAQGLSVRRGSAAAFSREGDRAVGLSSGSGEFPMVSVESAVCSASESPADGALHYGSNGVFAVPGGLRFGPRDLAASAANNGALHAFGVVEGGAILTVDCRTGLVQKHDLPSRVVDLGAQADGVGPWGPPTMKADVIDRVEALAINDNGAVAYSDSAGRVVLLR